MKVSNYIYEKYNERGMKAFEKRVLKKLQMYFKEFKINNVQEVICHNAYMTKGNGRGSYYYVIEIEFDGNIRTYREHTHDSEAWDNWNDPTSKQKRKMFEAVLSDVIELIVEDTKEEELY